MAALGAALGAAVGAALPLSRQEKELLGGVGASAVGAGRDALSSAAGVLREEVAHADLGAKVGDLADKVVQGVTDGGLERLSRGDSGRSAKQKRDARRRRTSRYRPIA